LVWGFGNLDHAIFQNSAGHSSDPLLIKFSATPGFAISGIEFNYATYRLNYPTTGYTYTTNNPNRVWCLKSVNCLCWQVEYLFWAGLSAGGKLG
jgi:hypothetical protein